MGRNRKDGDSLGLAGTRLVFKRGRFHYIHRSPRRWEDVGTDLEAAKRAAARFNSPADSFGTMAYWFEEFLADFKLQVAAKARSQRTLDDYTEYSAADGPLIAAFGKRLPETIAPHEVQGYLDFNARMDPPRLTQSNREKSLLSSCISWLIRTNKVPGMLVNPCMRQSGVKRNPEKPRERYVSHEEYRAVYDEGNRAVRLAMELIYRSLQRPEVDLLRWTPANVRSKDGGKVLRFVQSKSKHTIDIALTGALGALVTEAIGAVPQLHQPILHTLAGEAYTYDGLSAMLKQAQDRVRAKHKKIGGPLAEMPSFGLRDLKGKGATDMYFIDKRPIEEIQQLCGHADKSTTEKYIKQRWRVTAAPNQVEIA